MSSQRPAPGLTADWLNGWLAAIGVTVLVPETRLRWSEDSVPIAVFHREDSSPLEFALAESLPDEAALSALAIRAVGPGGKLGQTAGRDTYKARAAEARSTGDWTLSIAHTDLAVNRKDEGTVAKGPFNAGMEGDHTLWKRVKACRELAGTGSDAVDLIGRTLDGRAPRMAGAGLAFDARRFSSGVQHEDRLSAPRTLPIVELLAFHGISLFPLRGNGRKVTQRGWGDFGFIYPTWTEPLDVWAIDALLDLMGDRDLHLLGIRRRYRTHDYKKIGGEKRTAYFSELLR
jgi:hypothetical protein